MKSKLICLSMAFVLSVFVIPQPKADAFIGFFARRAAVNAQIVRNRRINQQLALQAAVQQQHFVAPVVVQRQFVPRQRRAVIVNGFGSGFNSQFIAPQRVVVQQQRGSCSGFFSR